MSKVSINYYLNDKLKATETKDGAPAFPVYIRVIHKRVLSRIKSTAVNINVTEKEFENLYNANIKHKVLIEMHGTKVDTVKGRVTKTTETKTEFVPYNIKQYIESETQIIKAFIDFAEDSISKDFVINKSKANFGDLLDFFCYTRFWTVLETVTTGFISLETQVNMQQKLSDYLRKHTDFTYETIEYIVSTNIGLHADTPNGERNLISLSKAVIKDFYCKGILTDKEAARFEFMHLLGKYNFDIYRLPFEKKEKRNPNPHEFLTFYVWLRGKADVLKYINAHAESYTRKNLTETANAAEKIFVDYFKQGYFKGWKEIEAE
jgi:hypothetical protein